MAAKIRGVKPEYWTDEAIVELSIPARLLFIGLWNFACDNGHLEDKPKQIRMRIFPADDVDVGALLDELVAQGRVQREAGYIIIPKFAEHQKPHRRWWRTCDQPWCNVPEGATSKPDNRGATVAQRSSNGGATADGDGEVEVEGEGDVKVKGRRRERKKPQTAIPDDWKPSEKHQQYAAEGDLDLSTEAFRFRNHALTHDRRCANWNAAFTNWLSKAYPPKQPSLPEPKFEGRRGLAFTPVCPTCKAPPEHVHDPECPDQSWTPHQQEGDTGS